LELKTNYTERVPGVSTYNYFNWTIVLEYNTFLLVF
jgi:hypothetical protein